MRNSVAEMIIDEQVPFAFPLNILKQTEDEGTFHVYGFAATTDFDLQGDIITEEALKASSLDLLKNSTVLLNHDLKQPIGKVTKVQFDKHGLLIDVLVSQTEPEIIQKIKEGVLNKFSIRGQVLERERRFMPDLDKVVNVIKRMALIEVSLVSVPANPEAKAIGWYVSKALQESDSKNEGGTNMQGEEIVIEELSPKGEEIPPKEADQIKKQEELKPASSTDSADKTEAAKPSSESQAASTEPPAVNTTTSPQPAPDVQKNMHDMLQAEFGPVWFLLDKLIAMGGQTGPIAQQIKAMLKRVAGDTSYPYPSVYPFPKTVSKEELGQMISNEVAKQVETAIKSIPTLRKGLIQPENGTEDVKKEFESLPPERKLKVALALQQG